MFSFLSYFIFFPFIFISWRLTLNIVVVFALHWHESATDLHVFLIPIPSPASLPIPSLWVFPVHHPWALASYIQPGLVICFTLDSILVSMLFSQNIPPSPSPTFNLVFLFSSEKYVDVEFLSFWDASILFPQWLYHFTFPLSATLGPFPQAFGSCLPDQDDATSHVWF